MNFRQEICYDPGTVLEFEPFKDTKSYLLVYGCTPIGVPRVMPLVRNLDGTPKIPDELPPSDMCYEYLHWHTKGHYWFYKGSEVRKYIPRPK